jgi:hypothetical protein
MPAVVRFNAAAARMIDAPCATNVLRRSLSASVQGLFFITIFASLPMAGRTLRWRSQFAPKPTCGLFGFHRIDQRDHALINVIASTAFECSDVKARPAGGDPCQRCCCFALWTRWPVKHAHDAVPCIRRERDTLSHR